MAQRSARLNPVDISVGFVGWPLVRAHAAAHHQQESFSDQSKARPPLLADVTHTIESEKERRLTVVRAAQLCSHPLFQQHV